jgi:hypothetical protein
MSADDGAVEALLCLEEASAEDALVKLEPPLPLGNKSALERDKVLWLHYARPGRRGGAHAVAVVTRIDVRTDRP